MEDFSFSIHDTRSSPPVCYAVGTIRGLRSLQTHLAARLWLHGVHLDWRMVLAGRNLDRGTRRNACFGSAGSQRSHSSYQSMTAIDVTVLVMDMSKTRFPRLTARSRGSGGPLSLRHEVRCRSSRDCRTFRKPPEGSQATGR
jgi:hypothetical protein